MSTITTKQLRENMSQVVRDLQNGKPVQISYRRKIIGTLQPVQSTSKSLRRGSAKAIQNFLASVDFGSIPSELQNTAVSAKQQIAILRNDDLAQK